VRGGCPFTKTSLYRLLSNVVYAGKVRYKDEVHSGEQPARIDHDTFQRVQALLRCHGPAIGPPSRHRFSALLKGLLHCRPCACAMTPAHSTRQGHQRYRYYTCVNAQKRGWRSCPSKSIPAAQIEQLVVGQIQQLGRDPQVLHQVLTQVRQQDEARLAALDAERSALERDLLRGQGELRKLLTEVSVGESNGRLVSRLAEMQERVGHFEQRIARLRGQMEALQQERLDEAEASRALAGLDPAWDAMTPEEQARVVGLLVSRVDYDGARGKVAITFHPLGLKTLAGERLGRDSQEHSA
jgi:site-specific DNA recombinase